MLAQALKIRSMSIAVLTFGFVLSFALLSTIYAPTPIVNQMVERDIREQAQLWEQRLLRNLHRGARSFVTGQISTVDEAFMRVIPQVSDTYRFKLFDRSGQVFWSTRKSDVGSTNSKPYWVTEVAQGEVYYQSAHKPTEEIDTFVGTPIEGQTHLVVEIYQPITVDGQFAGAIEFYSDITDLHATFEGRVRLVLGVATGFTTFIFFLLLLAVMHSNRANLIAQKKTAANERYSLDRQLKLANEVQLLGELNEWLQSSSSLTELFQMVSSFLEHLLPKSSGSIYIYSNSRDVLDAAVCWNGGTTKEHIRPTDCWGLRRGRTYKYGTSDINFTCDHAEPHDDAPYFCFPILAHGETVGLMHLKSNCENDHSEFFESRNLAQMCAEQISLAIANVRLRDELQDQSIRDPLTGLFNRRHVSSLIKKAASQSAKTGTPFSLISIDVDHFKKFNDTYGHDAGDIVLRAVGEAFNDAVDGDEVASRYGGEEFLIFLPGSDAAKGFERAEKLRRTINGLSIRYGEKTLPKIGISAGVASAPEQGVDTQQLIKIADDALYAAKAKGRNCVVTAGKDNLSSHDQVIAAE